MDDVIDRIKRIKQHLGNDEDDLASKKDKKSKQQNKIVINDTNNAPSKNKTPEKIKTPNKNKSLSKSKTPSISKTQGKNKILNKSQSVQSRKQKKYFETKTVSDFDDQFDQSDIVNMAELKEMRQRLQSHLVNLTKIINKNQSVKVVSQEINSNVKKRSPRPKDYPKHEDEVIKRKKNMKNQFENSKKVENSSHPINDSIPLPIDFTSSTSTFLLHERDLPNYYRSNNSTFSLENFMNTNATRSILKNSNRFNDTYSNFNSKPDLKTSDLNSISSMLEEAKKVRHSKITHNINENDRIPGETLLISENNEIDPDKSNDSDIYGIPFIPETYYDENDINNQGDFITFSISSDDEFNKNDNYDNVEISDELKARYLDQPDNTKTGSFSAIESPILKVKDLEFGEDIDMNNLYDIGSDEGYQVSLDDY